ncbi:MAG: RNA polymerase sigma factor [Bacteroidaceae bacterium]|nr:RNA polymerase sigma factor [Bacteroidaceae bacterium]
MTRTVDFQKDLLPHGDKLFRLAYRITLDSAEAEDIAEETLLRAWQDKNQLAGIRNLEVYLFTICRRLAIDRAARKEAANVTFEAAGTDPADRSALPDETLEQRDRLEWVRRIVATLPEKQRSVLQLRDIEERTVAETAEILGITPEDVKTTHHRARRAIREKLEQLETNGL